MPQLISLFFAKNLGEASISTLVFCIEVKYANWAVTQISRQNCLINLFIDWDILVDTLFHALVDAFSNPQ